MLSKDLNNGDKKKINYKDFKNRPSVVFALHLVGDKDKNIIGYAIGAGRPGAI